MKAWQCLAWLAIGAFLLEENPREPSRTLANPRKPSETLGNPRKPSETLANHRQPEITVYDKPISWGGDYSGEWT